jgi:hypothetical protein
MRQVALPLFGRLLLPSLAAVAGLSATAWSPQIASIPDGGCALFRGTSVGNDPSQVVEMELCRVGRAVFGEKASMGDAGGTVYEVRGTIVAPGQLALTTSRVLHDAPADGWVSCADDVISLAWNQQQDGFVGGYVSAQCDDSASLYLRPTSTSRYGDLYDGARDHADWLHALDRSRAPTFETHAERCRKGHWAHVKVSED